MHPRVYEESVRVRCVVGRWWYVGHVLKMSCIFFVFAYVPAVICFLLFALLLGNGFRMVVTLMALNVIFGVLAGISYIIKEMLSHGHWFGKDGVYFRYTTRFSRLFKYDEITSISVTPTAVSGIDAVRFELVDRPASQFLISHAQTPEVCADIQLASGIASQLLEASPELEDWRRWLWGKVVSMVLGIGFNLCLSVFLIAAAACLMTCYYRQEPCVRLAGEPEYDPHWPVAFPFPDHVFLWAENQLMSMGYSQAAAIQIISVPLVMGACGLSILALISTVTFTLRLYYEGLDR